MTKKNLKLNLFFFNVILILFIFCFKSLADSNQIKNNNIVIGSDDSDVKIKIFSSLTCPHCASFHIEVLPEIKKEYVDTGKAQIIFSIFFFIFSKLAEPSSFFSLIIIVGVDSIEYF